VSGASGGRGAAKGTVSRRGAEALGRRDVVAVAAVVVNGTFYPSRGSEGSKGSS
jgi:hypothetical protein